jgi:hypothetical protein
LILSLGEGIAVEYCAQDRPFSNLSMNGNTMCAPVLFPEYKMQLSGNAPIYTLERLDHEALDCAILPLPIDKDTCEYIRY